MTGCYKLECPACRHTETVSAADGTQPCPLCGAALTILWNAARADFERAQQESSVQQR
jgi:hypothetical protein